MFLEMQNLTLEGRFAFLRPANVFLTKVDNEQSSFQINGKNTDQKSLP